MAANRPAAAEEGGGRSFCPHCGGTLPPGAWPCPHCGAAFAVDRFAEKERLLGEDPISRVRQNLRQSPLREFKRRYGGFWDLPYWFSLLAEHRLIAGGLALAALILAAGLWLHQGLLKGNAGENLAVLENHLADQQWVALKALREGERLFDAESYEKAHAAFSRAIAHGADDTYPHFLRGLCSVKLGKHLNAIKDFSVLTTIDPANGLAFAKRGLAFEGMGRYQQALSDYHQALQGSLDGPQTAAEVHLHQSRAYSRLNDHPQALASIDKAIELGLESPEAFFQRAVTLDLLEKHQEALEDYDTVVKLAPKMQQAYLRRGLVYLKLQKYDQALPDLTKAIELAPKDPQAYFHRGMLATHLGNYQAAVSDLENAAALGSSEAGYMLKHVAMYEKIQKKQVAAAQQAAAAAGKPRHKSGVSRGKKAVRSGAARRR